VVQARVVQQTVVKLGEELHQGPMFFKIMVEMEEVGQEQQISRVVWGVSVILEVREHLVQILPVGKVLLVQAPVVVVPDAVVLSMEEVVAEPARIVDHL
jgi:hypothetical protein